MEDAIVTAAGDLFDRQGFNQTSLQEIADAVGIARPSIYHYFENREQIFVAGIDVITEIRNKIVEKMHAHEGDPIERLTSIANELGRLVSENPVWVRVLLKDEVALPPKARQRDLASRKAYFDLLADLLSDGIDRGYLRPLDERATALVIVNALTGLQYQYAADVEIDLEAFAESTVDVILQGVVVDRRDGTILEQGLALIREGTELIDRDRQQPGD